MGHFPAVLKELNNPDSLIHVGGVWNFMQALCEKISEDEMNIIGWIERRDQNIPRENLCSECFELYAQGLAWKPSRARD